MSCRNSGKKKNEPTLFLFAKQTPENLPTVEARSVSWKSCYSDVCIQAVPLEMKNYNSAELPRMSPASYFDVTHLKHDVMTRKKRTKCSINPVMVSFHIFPFSLCFYERYYFIYSSLFNHNVLFFRNSGNFVPPPSSLLFIFLFPRRKLQG